MSTAFATGAVVRRELADAASTVAGVQVSPYFRQKVTAGTGMVRRDQTVWPNKFGASVTWQIVIFLSQDIAKAEAWVDAHVQELRAALKGALRIEVVTQEQLALDTGTVPILLIQGSREE